MRLASTLVVFPNLIEQAAAVESTASHVRECSEQNGFLWM